MPNKTERILNSIKENAGTNIYQAILETCGTPDDNKTPAKQIKYTECILNELERLTDKETVKRIMLPCGNLCISKSTIEKTVNLFKKSKTLNEFLILLNEQHIGGGKLHVKGDKIIGIYEKCYCGLAKKAKNLSPLYCNCSAGWYKSLFESVYNNVDVKVISSILDGYDKCTFEITIN